MRTEIFNYLSQRARNWWVSLLVGMLAVVLGIWCLATPMTTLVAITYVFIAGFLVSGILDLVFAISNRQVLAGWGWTLAGGIIDLLFAFLLMCFPLPVVTTILVYFIGFWILFRSIWTIGIASELNNYVNSTWLLVSGILSLLFAIFYLFSPTFNGIFVVALVGIAFLFYGIFRILLSFQLRKINKSFKGID